MIELQTADYHYDLPPQRIALYPLQKRDDAKLLVYKQGQVIHSIFHSLPEQLPRNSFLFFNDTKVIPARLHFRKETGAEIEIFLLDPVKPSSLVAQAMQATNNCQWHCTIGNVKRWTENHELVKQINGSQLTATLVDRVQGIVDFSWNSEQTFAEILDAAGQMPLPPYLKRQVGPEDRLRYQTVYSAHEGAVAAPTAGLHFTNEVFSSLKQKDIGHDFLTLHVSAGTFQPIKTENAAEHKMHQEQIIVSRKNVENLLAQNRQIIPVGTTSMRTLESIYWYGAKLLIDPHAPFEINQDDPYTIDGNFGVEDVLKSVLDQFDVQQTDRLIGETSIYIRPGYRFRICKGLITNFHQPGSTLILLVAALVGTDWKKIYEEALSNDYRFLSYGDSSLLLPNLV
jgi:S-adenosylmethionine:tRNA ribosyltransferase-isomerase